MLQVLTGARELDDFAILTHQHTGLARIGEERHRHLCADEDKDVDVLQCRKRLIDGIRNLAHRHAAGPALDPAVECGREQTYVRRPGDAPCNFQSVRPQGAAGHQQRNAPP